MKILEFITENKKKIAVIGAAVGGTLLALKFAPKGEVEEDSEDCVTFEEVDIDEDDEDED